jgi:hypothetical protein
MAGRAARRRHHHPAAIGLHQIADEVIWEVIATRASEGGGENRRQDRRAIREEMALADRVVLVGVSAPDSLSGCRNRLVDQLIQLGG